MVTGEGAGKLGLPEKMVARLVAVLGEAFVLTKFDDVAEYRDPFWIPEDDTYAGAAVVMPGSTQEVREVVRIADEFGVPLWTHSQGRNNGYGGASPRVAGSLQVSLRRMDRVLEINEELAYAVVEPGVTWFDLHEALRAGGHRLMVSVPDLGWGSVIGNSMDNGITYLPNGADHMAPTGLEVVLPDGDLLRTGMGAVPGNKAWHLYKRMLGPSLDALFTQSNFGIVTRMGVWLQRTPEAYQTLLLGLERDSDLEAGIDTLRDLLLDGTLRGVPCLYPAPRNGALLLDLPVPQPRVWTEQALEEYGRETGLGRWAVRVGLWEDQEIRAFKAAKIKRLWERIPGASVHEGRVYSPDEHDRITGQTEKIHAGVPTLQLNEITPANLGHVGFSPIVALKGSEIRYVVEQMRSRLTEHGILFSGGIFCVSARAAAVVLGIQFDRTDPDSVRNAFKVAHQLVGEIGALGYGEYRAHLDFMDLAADQYSFNDHAYRRFVEKLKDAIDPRGIISPGRHGIWPSVYRRGNM
ncbi:FAD-binding oxidoreductase [Streptomyces sp. NPDC002143]